MILFKNDNEVIDSGVVQLVSMLVCRTIDPGSNPGAGVIFINLDGWNGVEMKWMLGQFGYILAGY